MKDPEMMSFKQIAEELGTSEMTVRREYERGIEKLRKYLNLHPQLKQDLKANIENK